MLRRSRDARAVRRFLQIIFLLLLLTAGIGGRYLYNRGLTKSWRELVVAEVRKHGVEVSFTRLTVRPFRGLVAKDVKFYDSPARNRVIAHMNEMVIEANYANAAKHKPFLDALTLVDTTLRIPLDSRNPFGPAIRVDRLNARVLFPPDQVQVTRLDAMLFGIRVHAKGSLLIPPGFTFSQEKSEANLSLMDTLVRELSALRYEGALPTLTLNFSGDLGRPEEIVVNAQLDGEKIRHGRYALASIALSATWQNNVLLLSRMDAADAKGRLQASGSYAPETRTAELRLRSGLDLPALLRSANVGGLDDFAFQSPPKFDLTARAEFSDGGAPPRIQMLGHMGVGNFTCGTVPVESLSADFSWDGRRWAVRDFALRQANGGELTGNAQQDYDEAGIGDFRIGLVSTIQPSVIAPLLGPAMAAQLAQVKFYEAPRLTLSARGPVPGLDTLSAAGDLALRRTGYPGGETAGGDVTFRHSGHVTSGELKLGRTTIRGIDAGSAETTFRYDGREVRGNLKLGRTVYRGTEARHAEAAFRFDGRMLTLDSFEATRAEGSGRGSFTVDLQTKLWRIRNVQASIFPAEVAMWIDPDLVQDLKPYRFGKRPPLLRIDGTLDPRKGGTNTRLTVDAEAPGGMDYTLAKKELHFGEMKGKLFFTDERLKLTDVRAELYGGTLNAEGDVSIVKGKPGHAATVRLAGVDFSRLSKLYFGFDDSKGKMDASCTFTGRGEDVSTMRGDGEVSVTEGNVFAIPFLGPFSEILNKIVPGMGYSRARKATANFAIGDGIVTAKNLAIIGNGFSMYGGGRIWLIEDKIDFDIRLNAQGLPGVLLFPVSKLLEYRANSRFSKPDWHMKAMPRFGGEKAQ